ncbi:MAG: acetate--CoA ligase family protein [Dongiaceae bacterium]
MDDLTLKRQRNLKRALNPRHVAFVGGQVLTAPIQQCQRAGFAGKLWVVNPKYPEIAGVPAVKRLADLPEPPDVAYLAVPREMTVEMVRELAAMGAAGAICYAAGFAEVGGEGVPLQRALVEAAGELALIGPNCYGIINYVDGLHLFASDPGGAKVERGVALVMQSGNIALNVTMNQRSVPLSYVITAGNQAVLEIADYLECFADDPKVTAIGLYIEGLADVPRFAAAATRALANGKPVVALKAGTSELGGKLAMSHTSSLAGSDKLYDALFDRLGIVRAHSLDGLLETTKLLAVAGVPAGNRLVVFTCSGGDSLMTADRAQQAGVALPPFKPETHDAIRAQLPVFASVSNPLDYNTSLWGDREALERCFTTAIDENADAAMLVIDFAAPDPESHRACVCAMDALIAASRARGKPGMVTSTLPELLPEAARDHAIAEGVAPMQGLESAIDAFAAAARLGRRRAALAAAGGSLPPLHAVGAIGDGRRMLPEAEAKAALAAHGLGVPEGRLADAAGAPNAAAALGFPVAVKLAVPVLAHKTEAGAVKLRLESEAAVAAVVAEIAASLARYKPGAKAERFLVERQVAGAVAELIVGVKRDPQFGPVLVVGAGGILVEMIEDAATLLLPTTRAEVAAALGGLRVAKLLRGYRGKPAGDSEAAIDAVMAVAAYAEANRDRLVELDVNPLMVLPEGEGAVAVDALVLLGA